MRIVADDSVRFNANHEAQLKKIGGFGYYSAKSSEKDFFESVKEADVIIVNKTFYNGLIPKLKIKLVATWSTGYDCVDIKKCRKHGITVSNVPGYSTDSVAEHVFTFIMEFTKKFSYQREEMDKGKWNFQIDPSTEIRGKTLGIIGFGNIGKRVSEVALGFGMRVLVHNRSKIKEGRVKQVGLDELLKNADFITLHVPLTDETRHLISKKELNQMKPSAYLINCARGNIVNEHDLADALKNNVIAGAGIDVFSKEPLPLEHEFHKLDNLILTPHMAFVSNEALSRLSDICIGNIVSFLDNNPKNVVN